ncbi:hypothetical protein [Cohnella candidum]|uniref:Uncharacterized protein n=1 Tax=Cohnella candidum TaxID=2674991 RepID=A0A3G3JX99_9BACL|nr:hypothetical protein [Cohnella candidum]AYQ72873.1 hypothetical protein EAV92_10045 [Cohnella candidum]
MAGSPIGDWNVQLQQCMQDLEWKRKRERSLARLEADIGKQREVVESSFRRFQREEEEAKELAASMFSQYWFKLFGKWEDRLGTEEKEAAEAKLKYDAASDLLSRLEKEREELASELAEVADADLRLDSLKRAKESWIREHDAVTAAEMEALSGRIGEIGAELREIGEAERAGEQAKQALLRAEDRLESAKNWGTYDMLGGGMIATAIKRGRMDEASDHIHEAQYHLRRFAEELKDVRMTSEVGVPQVEGFLSFADYFFDGFISDWMVQGRIRDSLDSVGSHLDKTTEALQKLRLQRKSLEGEEAEKRSRFDRIVEGYGA